MSAQSNVTSSIACAESISSKLDSVQSTQSQILSRLSSIESKIGSLESRIDAINNAIDSLENVLTTAIQSIKDVLLTAINRLFDLLSRLLGGSSSDRTDEILAAINNLSNAIFNGLTIIGRGIDRVDANLSSKIDSCCNELVRLINSLIKDAQPDRTNEIIEEINRCCGRLGELIGGAESRIITAVNNIDCSQGDWVSRILSAIAALTALLKGCGCDIKPIQDQIQACCRTLEYLIRNINVDNSDILTAIDLSKNYLAIKIHGNTNILNNIDYKASNILNVVNNAYSNTNNILNNYYNQSTTINNSLSNLTNNIQNVQNIVYNNVTNVDNTNITNILNNIDYKASNILNVVNNAYSNTNNILNNYYNQSTTINNSLSEIINRTFILQDAIADIQCSEGEETQLVQIKVPIFVRCNGDEPEFEEVDIYVRQGLEATELLKFTRIAEIEGKQCKQAVALIPEWWQVRLEGGIPQLVVAFGEVSPNGKCGHSKYPMTIPHFRNIKLSFCPFPRYKKGNYELIAYFKDNSKLIINAFNEYECERVYNAILPWIEPEYASSVRYKIGKRVSYPFKEIWVCPRFGKFFSKGNRDTNPDWVVHFESTD